MQKLMKRLHKNQKGFTLVELMVVVVIIGVLVAIAIPIFNQVSARAQAQACQADQRILEGALNMWQMAVAGREATIPALGDLDPFITGGTGELGSTDDCAVTLDANGSASCSVPAHNLGGAGH